MLAHALIKSSLFFASGIILHRLRSISEPVIFGKGKALRWTAALWFLGGLGLAGAPGFSTMLGEAAVSSAAKEAGVRGLSMMFLFAGVMTSAAVFRVGMHTFLGWGTGPISDCAAQVDELPETKAENEIVFWFHFVPPALSIALAVVLTLTSNWQQEVRQAAAQIYNQTAYWHTVYTGQTVQLAAPEAWRSELPGAMLRGALAAMLAILLSCTSVFRDKIARRLRLGAFLEGPLTTLRTLQSGHPGDYAVFVTVGLCLFGTAAMFLLR